MSLSLSIYIYIYIYIYTLFCPSVYQFLLLSLFCCLFQILLYLFLSSPHSQSIWFLLNEICLVYRPMLRSPCVSCFLARNRFPSMLKWNQLYKDSFTVCVWVCREPLITKFDIYVLSSVYSLGWRTWLVFCKANLVSSQIIFFFSLSFYHRRQNKKGCSKYSDHFYVLIFLPMPHKKISFTAYILLKSFDSNKINFLSIFCREIFFF